MNCKTKKSFMLFLVTYTLNHIYETFRVMKAKKLILSLMTFRQVIRNLNALMKLMKPTFWKYLAFLQAQIQLI